ncbi:XVIPCD domain-containing protein [Lysobacter humi (ex Lee et al. 2017)]
MDRTTRTELAADRAATGTGPYTLTVYAAAPGTPVRDDTGHVHTSVAGHVYYSVSDGRRSDGYGFSPIEGGSIRGPGQVVRDEHLAYQKPLYARTLEISADQYARLREYGESAIARTNKAFDLQYHGASNSCIDFTWKALEQAGLRRELQVLPGVRIDLPRDHEGQLKVLDNIRDFERLAPPIPGSPHNREQRHPMPSRTPLQWLLSENERDPAAPPRPAAAPDDPRLGQIRDAVHRLDAARGRTPDEASERLAAGLYTEVARNPAMRRVDDVVLSTATHEHPAGRMAFAVHRPFGEREPVFHAGVDVQAALAQPVDAHHRQAEQVREQQQAQGHAQAQGREHAAPRPPMHTA